MARQQVLLVDDDRRVQGAVTRFFGDEYDVRHATTGEEAMSIARRDPIIAVVLDYRLPDRTGLEVLSEIKSSRLQVPVVMMTGYDSPELRAAALELGARNYFSKPLNLDDLLASVRRIASDRSVVAPEDYGGATDEHQTRGENRSPTDLLDHPTHTSPDPQRSAGLPVLALPTDRPHPRVPTFRGARRTRALPRHLTEQLRALSRQEDVTLFVALLSVFQTLLSRYTGQDDIVVGSSIPTRDSALLEEFEPCAKTALFRTDLSGDPSFRELLARVRDVTLRALAHGGRRLAEESRPEPGAAPLEPPQVTFAMQDQHAPIQVARSVGDLALSILETDLGLTTDLEYNAELFEAATIDRMLSHFQALLEEVVADPAERLSALSILTEGERHQLLVEWNETQAEYPRHQCAHELFEEQVERTPDAVALVFGSQQVTYRELNRRANRLAHHLRELGVGPEALVGIRIERSVEMVVGLLAILKAGGAYVPLDPTYPRARLDFMLADARPAVLLTRQRLAASLEPTAAHVVCLDDDVVAFSDRPDNNPRSGVTSRNLAYVIYTSGSTGQPKGTLIAHQGLVNYLSWAMRAYSVANGCGAPVHSPLGFDLTVTSLWLPLLAGRTVELVPEDRGIEGLSELLRARSDFSLVKITPAHLSLLTQQVPAVEAAGRAQAFVIGGEALSWENLEFWLRHAPATRLINEYGPTETVVGCCVYEARTDEAERSGPVPIGRPIANTRLYVLDRHRQPVPIGVPGELYIGGDGVGRGYLNRPELTTASFLSDPFSNASEARLYKTGDLVRYLPDGNLEFLGRIDHQVKLRGFRVEPAEIETALEQHPFVRTAVVVPKNDAPRGMSLLAYFEARAEPCPTADQLRHHLAERLPAYMIPSAFVHVPTLPLTPSGKVDRQALPAPDRSDFPTGEGHVLAPRDAVEAQLVTIWEELLYVRPIGLTDDFFELGGDSLRALDLLLKIEQTFGRKIQLTALFPEATVATLAALLRERGARARWPRLAAIQPAGRRPPFFCVDAFGLFRPLAHRLGPHQPFLGLFLDPAALPTPFTIEDVAAYHVQTIRERQPHGPYYVGGWCDAGVVAYEIAQQLQALNEDVALVILFDSTAPNRETLAGPAAAVARFRTLAGKVGFHWQNLRRGTLTEACAYLAARSQRIRDLLNEGAWRGRYTLRRWAGRPIEARLRNVDQIVRFSLRSYRPRAYPGRVVLFRRSERPAGPSYDPATSWRELVDNLEVHDIRGDHSKMFVAPNLDVLATTLRACLEAGEHRSAGGDHSRKAAVGSKDCGR